MAAVCVHCGVTTGVGPTAQPCLPDRGHHFNVGNEGRGARPRGSAHRESRETSRSASSSTARSGDGSHVVEQSISVSPSGRRTRKGARRRRTIPRPRQLLALLQAARAGRGVEMLAALEPDELPTAQELVADFWGRPPRAEAEVDAQVARCEPAEAAPDGCAICQEDAEGGWCQALCQRHAFHEACLRRWFQEGPGFTCPLCRRTSPPPSAGRDGGPPANRDADDEDRESHQHRDGDGDAATRGT
eukprot:TRINITY_DN1455_c0_g1_i3.p1 TRINITY_DN1455_c0_g1~~TRINITY_DN1455_c0_g1_i3.p1  ORF type:complete len:245 (-),score=24.59 TRINITY_DN1455_c0_g1_i3:349-1083(-)